MEAKRFITTEIFPSDADTPALEKERELRLKAGASQVRIRKEQDRWVLETEWPELASSKA